MRPLRLSIAATLIAMGLARCAWADGFGGIIEFAGHDEKNASNPCIAGVNKTFYWSQLEPEKGKFRWDIIDASLQKWSRAHKKLIFRVSTSGFTNWERPYSGRGTPQWVLAEGVPTVTETDGSVYPQYWNETYLAELRQFLLELGKRYDGNPSMPYLQMAVGSGGETLADTHDSSDRLALWKPIGYSDVLWWKTVQRIVGFYREAFPHTPLAIMIDSTFMDRTRGLHYANVVQWAVEQHLILQDNGLLAKRRLKEPWPGVPHVVEQRWNTKQSGDSLREDIRAGLEQNAMYILIFRSDLDRPENQTVLEWAAQKARP